MSTLLEKASKVEVNDRTKWKHDEAELEELAVAHFSGLVSTKQATVALFGEKHTPSQRTNTVYTLSLRLRNAVIAGRVELRTKP